MCAYSQGLALVGQELGQAFPSSFIEAPLQSISQNAASFTRVSPRDCWQDGSHSHLEYNQKNSILSFCHILFTGSRSLENTLIGHETLIKKMFFPKAVLMGLLIYMCQWAVDYEVNTCKSTVEFLGCGVMSGYLTIHTDRNYVSHFSVFINLTSKSPHVNMMHDDLRTWKITFIAVDARVFFLF